MLRTTSIIALAGILLLQSCKKNEDKGAPSGGSLETKVIGKWRIVSSIDSNTAFNPAKITDVLPECEKDDVYIFSSDKTYTIDGGANKCSNLAGGGTWAIRTIKADSLELNSFEADIVSCLCYSYPSLVYIDDIKMILRGRDNSGQVYTVNTYRKL